MSTYLVGYDLDKPDQEYEPLIKKLKSYGTWWHNLDSTWFVVSTNTVTQVRDELGELVGKSDKLLVVEVTLDSWASRGFNKEANDWLTKHVAGQVKTP